ncbi:hypothetical protein LRP50_10995 [Enterovibrio sp. ZSDZ42]|uniref:Uncharacterized protein n=1 Tax=Enterovibrio gelatinilyticus TaxID=2899819 RepID=A0ABT5R061_9GAMM|nr:hypothetical protein [Enterovibrio sp. ZSDZ42]MDD1793656.1 hypothetical protein [Enterovibrio sp. ZSDZ42]
MKKEANNWMESFTRNGVVATMGLLLFVCFSVQSAISPDLDNQISVLCDKMQSCALESLGGENVDTANSAFVEKMIGAACRQIRGEFDVMSLSNKVDTAATACLKSMTALSCQAFESDVETPECSALAKMTQNSL